MRKVNYVFKFYDLETQTFYTLKNDIDEWQSFGVSFGREKEKTTFVKSYVANFTFVKEDAAWLRDIIFTRGFNVRIAIYVYSADMFGTLTTQYRGFLDLTNAEITSVFKCPIYSGGFFNSLDNCWSEKYTLEPKKIKNVFGRDLTYTAFENVEFNGGVYKYEEVLGIENGAKITLNGIEYGTSENIYYTNYLPIKIKNENSNSKLKYFKDASNSSLATSSNSVSQNNCFVYAKNKLNAGKFTFSMNNCGNIYFHDAENYMKTGHHISEITKINITMQLGVYIYNEVIGHDTWYPLSNLLNSTRTSSLINTPKPSTIHSSRSYEDIYKYSTNENGNPIAHIKISNIDLTNNINTEFNTITTNVYDFSWIKDENASSGMYIAIGVAQMYFNFYDSGNHVIGGNTEKIDCEFEFTDNFQIKYTNENFILNRDKKIHGIKPYYIFNDLIDKINTKNYNIEVNTTLLESKTEDMMLFSPKGLIGTTVSVYENGLYPSLNTSLNDFLDFTYKALGLQMYCRYDVSLNKYYITFVELANTMQSVKIDTINNIASLTIKPFRDGLKTRVVAGWENESDAIFGRFEFNCKNTFKTSNTELEENEMSLVPTYRAGALDIETYIHANYGNFQDKEQDGGNVYVIIMNGEENATYTIADDYVKKSINLDLRPSKIIMAHYKEIAGMVYYNKLLTFIETTGYAEIDYQGKQNDNITILESPYFIPFEATIEVPAVTDLIPKIEANPLGYFEFTYNDKIYKGYIVEGTESLTINPMNEQPSTLRLLLTNDSEL